MRKFLFCVLIMSVFQVYFSNIYAAPIKRELGLVKYNPEKAFQGYTLFAPKHYTETYLMDMEGQVITGLFEHSPAIETAAVEASQAGPANGEEVYSQEEEQAVIDRLMDLGYLQ